MDVDSQNDLFRALSEKLAGLQLNDSILAQGHIKEKQHNETNNFNCVSLPSSMSGVPSLNGPLPPAPTTIPIMPQLLPSTPLPQLSMPLYIAEALQTNTLTYTVPFGDHDMIMTLKNIHQFCTEWAPSKLGSRSGASNTESMVIETDRNKVVGNLYDGDIEWIAIYRGTWPILGLPNPFQASNPVPFDANSNPGTASPVSSSSSSTLCSSIPGPTLDSLQTCFNYLSSTHRVDGAITLTVSALDTLALSHGLTSGKWILFVREEGVDRVWRGIVELVTRIGGEYEKSRVEGVFARVGRNKMAGKNESNSGRGGGVWGGTGRTDYTNIHRTSDSNPGRDYMIYIYVPDFSDVAVVFSIRNELRELGAQLSLGTEAGSQSRGTMLQRKIGFKMDLCSVLGIYRGNEWGISV
ncbi:hypothetical protein K435DRAFT_773594, partial [Dendrothele bispora CBS 962.96]